MEKKSICWVLPVPKSLWLLLFWAALSARFSCQAQEPAVVVEQLRAARHELEKDLVSALAIGRLRQQTLKDRKPVVTEHDVQIFYDAPRFRVHVIDVSQPDSSSKANSLKTLEATEVDSQPAPHDLRLEAVADEALADVDPVRNTRPSQDAWLFTERLVIFDGSEVYSILSTNGRQRGKIFFDFQQQSVLRSTGYPYVPPLQLWQAGISAQLDPKKIEIQKLNQQGMILSELSSAYTTKYYFFDEFAFDLRRVIFTVPKAKLPFREISLRWGQSNGVRYVTRYASKDRYLSEDPAAPPVDSRNVEIEFSRFDANAPIADEVFSLSSLNLPNNTPFDDHRANVDGQPKKMLWNGKELVDAKP